MASIINGITIFAKSAERATIVKLSLKEIHVHFKETITQGLLGTEIKFVVATNDEKLVKSNLEYYKEIVPFSSGYADQLAEYQKQFFKSLN